MKSALILHGTDSNHASNWFPWLEQELIKLEYKVWVPDLPQADQPNIQRYNDFLLNHSAQFGNWEMSWTYDSESILIGHSSGAVEILGLLNDLSFPDITVKTCFLVGAFKGDLGWDSLKGMVVDFDYERIKHRSNKFIFIHSDDDPYCPIEETLDLCNMVGGKFIELKGQGHFSFEGNPKYDKFPELLEIIKAEAA